MKITKEEFKNIVRETLQEESEYQTFFKKALEKTGKSIPQMSDEEKKAFFNKIETAWKGRGEKNERFGRGVEGPTFGSADESVNEGKFRKEENTLRNVFKAVEIDFNEALQMLKEDGVLEAMDHMEHAIERIKDMHKILKRKS